MSGADGDVSLVVCVTGLSGEPLLDAIPAEESWSVADVADRLPALLPGRKYDLVLGDEVLQPTLKLSELEAGGPKLCLSAVVSATEKAQEEMDLALIAAAAKLDLDRVSALLAAGASAVFVQDPEGVWGSLDRKSALHAALERRGGERAMKRQVVEALILARADVNALRVERDWRGCSSRMSAFEMVLPYAMDDVGYLRLFLDAGADANTRSVHTSHSISTDGNRSYYILHQAVQDGKVEIARALLDARADVEAVASEHTSNERGFNRERDEKSLHIACGRGNVAMTALLLEHGANVNAVRQNLLHEKVAPTKAQVTDDPRHPDYQKTVRCVPVQETALHLAISTSNAALVSMLVCAGADVSIPRFCEGVGTLAEELCGENAELLGALRSACSPSQAGSDADAPPREDVAVALCTA